MLFLFGAEGETRTLAPVSRPTPLAGAPRHQLEYFCIGNKLMLFYCTNAASGTCSTCYGAESGIRTHGTLPYDGFQDRSVITTSVSLHIALIYYHKRARMSTTFSLFSKIFFKMYNIDNITKNITLICIYILFYYS